MLNLTVWTMARVFPSTEGLPGLDVIDAKPLLQQFYREAPLTIRSVLWVAVLVFQVSPLFTVGVPLPARWLSAEKVDQHAQRLSGSPIYLVRQIVLMLKTIGGLVWGAAPEVRRKLELPLYDADPGTWRQS